MRPFLLLFVLLVSFSLILVVVIQIAVVDEGYTEPVNLGIAWGRTYGGKKGTRGECVVQCGDGGYLLAGYTHAPEEEAVYLLSVDPDGQEIWSRTHLGLQEVYDLVATEDGGFIVAGATNLSADPRGKDLYLLKVNASGNEVWRSNYKGGQPYSAAYCIVPSGDGGFVVGGAVGDRTYGNDDLYLLKINGDGGTVWERTYDHNSGSEEARAITPSGDGGFVVAGITWPSSDKVEDDDIYLLKIDALGNKVWERVYGTGDEDWPAAVTTTNDGAFLIAGTSWYAFSEDEDTSDVYLLKTDASGNKVWEKTFGTLNENQGNATGEEIRAMASGSYLLAGDVDGCWMYLVEIDDSGDRVWERVFSDLGGYCSGADLIPTGDGGFVVAGSWEHGGDEDALLVKLEEGNITPIIPIPECLPLMGILAFIAFGLGLTKPAGG